MKSAAAAMILAASLFIPATAHADCGDPGQDPCTGPVPTVEQVVDIMDALTDDAVPAANKTNIVSPAFSPDEVGNIDDQLRRLHVSGTCGSYLPARFIVTDIQPAPNNFAGATLAVPSGRRSTPPGPIVLVEQHGHWLITHDTATVALDAFDYNATRYIMKGKGPWC
jgi:hypothetical protein